MVYNEHTSRDYSPVPRHMNSSSNFSFADGHVENLLYAEVAYQSMIKDYWNLREPQ